MFFCLQDRFLAHRDFRIVITKIAMADYCSLDSGGSLVCTYVGVLPSVVHAWQAFGNKGERGAVALSAQIVHKGQNGRLGCVVGQR
ncbi:hypothetical protein [Alicyclobacillus fodiniaquatilis]|uniref:Uncharacterized protein n=1 Tax=Alicyclobacillus fodiniaquatilis TaxID=1661150 RepID=A0ABW4JK90_9BACL